MTMLPRFFPVIALIFISVLLSGCVLKSEKPILDASKGERILDGVGYIASMKKKGRSFQLEFSKDAIEPRLSTKENAYILLSKKNQKRAPIISFHDIGRENIYIGQYTAGKEYLYFLSEINDQNVYLLGFGPAKKEYKRIIDLGYTPTLTEGNLVTDKLVEIGNEEDLKKLANYVLSDRNLTSLKGQRGVVAAKLFSKKSDFENAQTKAAILECLRQAGHPSSPLPKGVTGVGNMAKIKTKKARKPCDFAFARDETNKSVRYALARIAYIDKQYASVAEYIYPLLQDGSFPLAHQLKGQMYVLGAGLPKDGKKALHHYKMAVDNGLSQALQVIGTGYSRGTFGTVDKEKAFSYFQRAAQHNIPAAMSSLAFAYYNGAGVKKDLAQSAHFAAKAAKLKDVSGEYLYGFMLVRGQGVQQDFKLAKIYIERAANKKHAASQALLGDLYRKGNGVRKNSVTALKWYKKAAAQNHAHSQYVIGWMYSEGQGVAKNYKTAIEWLKKAAANKSAPAKKLLASVTQKEKQRLDATIAALKAQFKGPDANQIKAALQARLNVGFKRLDAMGDMCNDVQRSQNPIAAVMCLTTLGGKLNSKTMGMSVSQVKLDKCHAMKDKSFICRYRANISGNPGNQNPWMGMMTALKDVSGYQYASFVRSKGGWSVERIFKSCIFSKESVNCTYEK